VGLPPQPSREPASFPLRHPSDDSIGAQCAQTRRCRTSSRRPVS